ncbi:MAG TPA: hypothetical protein VIU61_18105 [Kofleriaceae bacterium]
MATKKPQPTIAVDPRSLFALLGKPLEDKGVQALLKKSGKTKLQKPGRDGFYAFAKEAGYTLLFRPMPGAPKGTPPVVDTIFLHSEGQDGNRGFAFPFGLEAGMLSDDLRKSRGPSLAGNQNHDLWKIDGLYVDVVYTSGSVAGIDVQGDYSKYRVLDLRIRAHEQDWDERRRLADQAKANAQVSERLSKKT